MNGVARLAWRPTRTQSKGTEMRVGIFRAAAAAMIAALLLAACSQDIRDVKLSEMNQPENSKKLLEDLSQSERETIAYYVAERSVRGDIDYTVTIGDVLELAAKEKAEAEVRRVQEAAAAAERQAKAEALREVFEKQKIEADKQRLAEMLDQTVDQVKQMDRRKRQREMEEMTGLVLGRAEVRDEQEQLRQAQLRQDLRLLDQFIDSGAAPASMTIRDAWEKIGRDREAVVAQLQEAKEAAARRQQIERYTSGTSVGTYVRQAAVRTAIAEMLSAEDIALLDAYAADAVTEAEIWSVYRMSVRDALQRAREANGHQ